MSKFYDYINEAFNVGSMEKAASLIIKSLSSQSGYNFYPFGGEGNNIEQFSKSNGNKGSGYTYILDDGRLIRLNWETNKKSASITSVDMWKSMKEDDPFKNLEIPVDFNIMQTIPYIVKFLKGQSLDEAKKPSAKKKQAAKKWKVDINLVGAEFWNEVNKQKRWKDKPHLAKAAKERSSRKNEVKDAEEKFEKQKIADPNIIFQDLEDLVGLVTNGIQKSLLITGMAGIGKTYTVMENVQSMLSSANYVSMKGKSSPFGLYSTLFLHRKKLIIFDDMDSVFDNKDTINMLKAALDTSESNISWVSSTTTDLNDLDSDELDEYTEKLEMQLKIIATNPGSIPVKKLLKLPNTFYFPGQIIFISNISKTKMNPAILSRSFAIDITLNAKSVIKRMESIIKNVMPEVKLKDKKEALKFLSENEFNKQINIRTLINTIKCKISGNPRWQHLSKEYA